MRGMLIGLAYVFLQHRWATRKALGHIIGQTEQCTGASGWLAACMESALLNRQMARSIK